jgi:putative chitinase
MHLDKFFAAIKPTVFGGSFTQAQVNGINAILAACADAQVTDNRCIAYALATPMIETGGSYVPIVENLNYSYAALRAKFPNRIGVAQAQRYGRTAAHPANQEAIANIIYGGAWGARNLGNTQPGDGWLYRGRGLPQLTGRRLYTHFGYIDNPDAVCDVNTSAVIMVEAMRDGVLTGRKFTDYFNAVHTNWVGARAMVNGNDRAQDIATQAMRFWRGLQAAA